MATHFSPSDTANEIPGFLRIFFIFAVSEGEKCVVVYGEAKLLQGKSAENYLGRPLSPGLQPGERSLIILSPKTWRWARIAD